jgi:hypothetical protein
MTEPVRKTKAEPDPEPGRAEAAVAGKPLENVDRSESD